jgi:hypothetical protein
MIDYGLVKLLNLTNCSTDTWIRVYLDKENKIVHLLDLNEPGRCPLTQAIDREFHIEVGIVIGEDLYGYKAWLYCRDGNVRVHSLKGLLPRINENEKLMPADFLLEMKWRKQIGPVSSEEID